MKTTARLAAAAACLLACNAPAQDALSVRIELPDDETWEVLNETVVGETFSREWVPAGTTYETAKWLIAEQKVRVDDKTNAMEFLEMVYAGSEEGCTDVSHDEPVRERINKRRVAIGRTMCARRVGEEFGTFSDRIVVIDNGFAFIVTSELRFPPMVVAGVLTFEREESPTAGLEFMDREERSRRLVRERVIIE